MRALWDCRCTGRTRRLGSTVVLVLWLALVLSSCGDDDVSTVSDDGESTTEDSDASAVTAPSQAWIEEDLTFLVGRDELHGILTVPVSEGPHVAVVIVTGSEDPGGGLQSGLSSTYFTDLAHRFAESGYAAFRYDTRGVGQSDRGTGVPGLETRRDEAIAALQLVQGHPAVRPEAVGLWGISQEAWVISMAAADRPDDVAFVIAVSGAGISVAEQQVWGIESQSRAAGLDSDDVARATVFGRLIVDWQLSRPINQDTNTEVVDRLGDGPWKDFHTLVYDSDVLDPAERLTRAIEILTSVQDEPWAQALHLQDLYLPILRSIPPDQLESVNSVAERNLLTDPADHLTQVTSPVLAFFGEEDIVQPSHQSAELYASYLRAAGNTDVTIILLPGVGHEITPATVGYWNALLHWLDQR